MFKFGFQTCDKGVKQVRQVERGSRGGKYGKAKGCYVKVWI